MPVTIGGVTFADESAFADQLISVTGPLLRWSGTGTSLVGAGGPAGVSELLTDQQPGTFVIAGFPASGQQVTLGFVDNRLVNGAGADLALFELGFADSFRVTIGGVSRTYTSVYSGVSSVGPFSNLSELNVARVDLSDFGVAAGAALSEVTIGLDIVSAPGFTASLSLVGAINSQRTIPEPSSALLLLGAALAGLGVWRRRS